MPLSLSGYRIPGIHVLRRSRSTSAFPTATPSVTDMDRPLQRSRSLSRLEIPYWGHAGASYVPFNSFGSVTPIAYRQHNDYTIRNYFYDKYKWFSPRQKRTQFHQHYYHPVTEFYPSQWKFSARGTVTGTYYWIRERPEDWQAYKDRRRFYDPYRRYYDPSADHYLRLYDYRPRVMDSLY